VLKCIIRILVLNRSMRAAFLCTVTGAALPQALHPCDVVPAEQMSQAAADLCTAWSFQKPAAVSAAGLVTAFTAAQQQLWHHGELLQAQHDRSHNFTTQHSQQQQQQHRTTLTQDPPPPSLTAPVGNSGDVYVPPGCRRRLRGELTQQCEAAGEHGNAVAELSYLTAQQVCSECSSSVLSATAPDDTALFSAQLRCLNEIVAVVETFWQCLDPAVRAAACSEVLAHKDAWVSPSEDTISLCESNNHR
jgi:hypothetical protein